MTTTDPFLWTCAELTRQICYSRCLYDATESVRPVYRDLQDLAGDFTRMQTTGQTFLGHTRETLRRDFDISNVGNSRTLLAIIDYLRSQSPLYKQHIAFAQPSALGLDGNDDSRPTEIAFTDVPSRKRAKVATVVTQPLPAGPNDQFANVGRSKGATVDWSHLLRWEQEGGDDEIIESDEMEDYTDEEEGVRAVDSEEEEVEEPEPKRTGKLEQNQITEVINDRIAYYTHQWRPGKGEDAAHQADRVKILKDAGDDGRRQQMEEKMRSDITYFERRLDQLCEEIMTKSPCNTLEEVRRVCGTLEGTVDLLEEAKWLHDICARPLEQDGDDETIEVIDLGSESEADPGEMLLDVHPIVETAMESNLSLTGTGRFITPESIDDSYMQSVQSTTGRIQHGRQPETASIHAVSQWDMDELIVKADRKRIVMKVVHNMRAEDRELIRTRVQSVRKQDLLTEVLPCVNMMLRKEKKMRGVLPKDTYKIVAFTRLYLCWYLAGSYFNNEEPREWRLKGLAETLETDGCPDVDIFYHWVRHILANTFSQEALRAPRVPSDAEVIVISDDED